MTPNIHFIASPDERAAHRWGAVNLMKSFMEEEYAASSLHIESGRYPGQLTGVVTSQAGTCVALLDAWYEEEVSNTVLLEDYNNAKQAMESAAASLTTMDEALRHERNKLATQIDQAHAAGEPTEAESLQDQLDALPNPSTPDPSAT